MSKILIQALSIITSYFMFQLGFSTISCYLLFALFLFMFVSAEELNLWRLGTIAFALIVAYFIFKISFENRLAVLIYQSLFILNLAISIETLWVIMLKQVRLHLTSIKKIKYLPLFSLHSKK